MKKIFMTFCFLLSSFVLDAQKLLLPVPYHCQGNPDNPLLEPDPGYPPEPNTWCTVACLHMLFDYYDHIDNSTTPLPGPQIASVSNTDDIAGLFGGHSGTGAKDARRAAHFSMLSNSADGAVTGGYSWRKIGYSAIDSTNGRDFLLPGTNGLVGWMEVLNEGYPVIFNGNFPWTIGVPNGADSTGPPIEETVIGHSILLVGYDLVNNLLYFHDPWYGPYVSYHIDSLRERWYSGNYVFAAPWEVKINAPDSVKKDTSFLVSASVRYSAPTVEYVQPNGPAFGQEFPIVNYSTAFLQIDSCSMPLSISTPVDTLYLIDRTQSSYIAQWSAIPTASEIHGSFTVKTAGLLQPTNAYSYTGYQDTIGTIVTGECAYSREDGSGMIMRKTNRYKTSLFPNPFVKSNVITISLPEAGNVEMKIHDELGRVVKTLSNAKIEPGKHIIPWDATGDDGTPLPAGKYFYSISVDGKTLPGEKAILVK